MTRKNRQPKTNGHAGPNGRISGGDDCPPVGANGGGKAANGHGPASMEGGGISTRNTQAATDDASGAFDAGTAHSSAVCSNHDACAGAAPPPPPRSRGRAAQNELQVIPLPGPTDFAAMQDGSSYANAVAARVDLVGLSARLLQSTDEKIAKAELDKVREMKFGKVGTNTTTIEESITVDWTGVPRPPR